MPELTTTAMSEKLAPPKVTIRRYAASRVCDVVVVVRGQEMVIRCPSYSDALKWARLECKSYKIPEPITDFPDDEEPGDVPLFLHPDTLGEMRSAQPLNLIRHRWRGGPPRR